LPWENIFSLALHPAAQRYDWEAKIPAALPVDGVTIAATSEKTAAHRTGRIFHKCRCLARAGE
jgi:hypothetical protein